MTYLLKAFFLTTLLLLIGGEASQVYAQRCGGKLFYIIRNLRGEIVNTEKVDIRYVRKTFSKGGKANISSDDPIMKFRMDDRLAEADTANAPVDSIKVLTIVTGCGLYLVEVGLEYENRVMSLRLHNIPEEIGFFVDSVPFEEGTFEN